MSDKRAPRNDDQISDSASYLGPDGGTLPLAGGEAGPRYVPAVERGNARVYGVVRKSAKITDFTGWQLGSYVPCDEKQVPGNAYDIGEAVDVGHANIITWLINYVPPLDAQTELGATPYVLSCIMEVSNNGSRWIPYTMLDNDFTQLNLNGHKNQPEPVGVGSIYATRSVYCAEIRSPNMLAGDTPEAPYDIQRRLDQPTFELDTDTPPQEATQIFPIGFHFTFDVAPFTDVRLRWRHIEVDETGTFVAGGPASAEDPLDPALNGFVTIHYSLVTG